MEQSVVCQEKILLRKLLKEELRQNGVRISAPNEFNRWVHSMAHKIHEDPVSVMAVVRPIVEELMCEMLATPTAGRKKLREETL